VGGFSIRAIIFRTFIVILSSGFITPLFIVLMMLVDLPEGKLTCFHQHILQFLAENKLPLSIQLDIFIGE